MILNIISTIITTKISKKILVFATFYNMTYILRQFHESYAIDLGCINVFALFLILQLLIP